MPCEKRATAQIAHLVFADTLANAKKTKRAIFHQHSIYFSKKITNIETNTTFYNYINKLF